MTAMLPSLAAIPARPPRQVDFGIQSTHPAYSLSTLQTPRCRDACKTRYWPACLALARLDFHQQVDTSFAQRNSRTALSSAPLFPFTGAFRDSIPAGWLRLGGEENSPSGFMRLRLVQSHRSSSVCELA